MAKQRASLKGRGREIQGLANRVLDAALPAATEPVETRRPAATEPVTSADLAPEVEAALAFEAGASETTAARHAPPLDDALPPEPIVAMPPRETLAPATTSRNVAALAADETPVPGEAEMPLDAIDVPFDEGLPPILIAPSLPPPVVAPVTAPAPPPPVTAPAPPPPVTAPAPPPPVTAPAPPPPAQPAPKPPNEDQTMDDLNAAIPGANPPTVTTDDGLTDDILAAVPPAAGDAEPITTVRSPLPPYSGAPTTAPSVGLAPVVTQPEPPATQPPGGPAPARLRVGGLVLEGPLSGEVAPPGPGVQTGVDKPIVVRDLTDEQAQRALARVTPEQLRSLSREIDRLYDRASQELANDALRGEKALELLHQSRLILVEKPENYVDAEYQVQRVHAMLIAANNSRQWAGELGLGLFRYETIWMFALLLAFILSNAFWPRMSAWLIASMGVASTSLVLSQAMPFLSTLFWGGLGGSIGALWSLWYHISERRDFDREYQMWYLTQPIMGMVLGGLVYLLFATGLLVLQAGAQTNSESLGVRLLPSLIAAIGGFRQNFVYEQLGRIVELFSGRSRTGEQNENAGGA